MLREKQQLLSRCRTQTLALELQRALTIEDPKFDDDVLKLMEAGAAHFIQDDEYC